MDYRAMASVLLVLAVLGRVLLAAASHGNSPPIASARCAGDFDNAALEHYETYFFGPRRAVGEYNAAACRAGIFIPRAVEFLITSRYLAPPTVAGARSLPAPNVAALSRLTGFRKWPSELVTDSLAKRLPRRIYRSPWRGLRMSVAETLGFDGKARETEVALSRDRTDANVDFFVYGPDGQPSLRSDFGTAEQPVMLPAPQICLHCHFDTARRVFRLRPPFAPPTHGGLAQARAR